MANDKEKVTKPASTPDKPSDWAKKTPEVVDKKTNQPKTTKEARDAARAKYEWKKWELDVARKEEADKAQASEKERQGLKTEPWKEPGVDPKVKESTDRRILSEKENLAALKETHDLDLQTALESMDIDSLDTQNKGAIHRASLAKKFSKEKIDSLPQKVKEEALDGITGPDGKKIDTTKPLSPQQAEVVKSYVAGQYIRALSNLSPEQIKDPKKLSEIENIHPGITDFVSTQPAELLTQRTFFEAAKKDPKILQGFIDSVKENGMLVTGITPESKLGKVLVEIIRSNVAEYQSIDKPQEGLIDVDNFKWLKDVLGASYEDLIYSRDFLLWPDHPLKKARDVVLQSFQDKLAQQDTPDPKTATPEQIQAYRKNFKEAFSSTTGIDGNKAEVAIKKMSREGLSPLVRFFADMFAPLGALMPGEAGDFWREYLKSSQQDTKNENSSKNANYEQYGKGSEGIDGLEPGSILAAANKYMGVNESKDGNLIREMHKSWWLDAGPGTAWCMSFVQHVLRKDMKFSDEQIGTWKTASAAAGHRIGRHTDTPQLGDIVLVKSSAAASGRHIAFFAWFEGDRVKILWWNQGNAVSLTTYPKSSVAEYRTLQKNPNAPKWTTTWSAGEIKSGHDAFPDTPVGPENYPSKEFLAQNGKTPETVPMGMRVNNPLNIKFTGSPVQRSLFEWVVGKSVHTDQGDPQIAFANPEAGMLSGLRLLLYKQKEHWLNTIQSMVADVPWWWTQGGGSGNPLGNNAAREIAQRAGLSLTAPLDLSDKTVMKKFVQSLLFQEHWPASNIYSSALDSSIAKL